jgi:hypothetical protein
MAEKLETPSAPGAAERLEMYKFTREDYLGAIRGERVPRALGGELMRQYLVRGIRHQASISLTERFAQELYGIHPLFSRAINARRVMSNRVDLLPPILGPEEIPYCIWYPETAEESTYRELVARHPEFRYHVGRACAVANYATLYAELDILPDIHIAEEARECGSTTIYEAIMTADVQFDVMDDYERMVKDDSPSPGCLNGDTVIRRMLEVHYKNHPYWKEFEACDTDEAASDFLFEDAMWGRGSRHTDITEDAGIAEEDVDFDWPADPRLATLLSQPLPKHLSVIDKDLLIQMAAYDGNIERYSRLRRPHRVSGETAALVHGIHHHTQFALWVLQQPDVHKGSYVSPACHARLIMNNILSSVNLPTVSEYHLPYLIWWPDVAAVSTYRELYRLHPCMAPQILRACMAGGPQYLQLFEHILNQTTPDEAVLFAAKGHVDPYYHARVAQRIANVGGEIPKVAGWKTSYPGVRSRGSAEFPHSLEKTIQTGWEACNDSLQCDVRDLDFMTCVPEEWKRKREGPRNPALCLYYINWPPGWKARTRSSSS